MKWRLTGYFALVLALLLLILGWIFSDSIQRDYRRTLSERLTAAVLEVSRSYPQTDIAGWPEGWDYISVTVLDRQGRELAQFNKFGRHIDPQATFALGRSLQAHELKTTRGFTIRGQALSSHWVEVLSLSQRALFLLLPFLLLLALLLAYQLIKRALQPVEAMTRVAEEIAHSSEYTRRVPEPNTDDEIARAARMMNLMLGRLYELIEREKAFSLAAAHELRTPLTVLLGQTQLAQDREYTPDEYRQKLARLEDHLQNLNRLVGRLLTLARSDHSGMQEPLDLGDLALMAAEQLKPMYPRVHFELELEAAPGRGDPAALQLAVTNLLENATKYGQHEVRVSTGTQADEVFLLVSDDGPGIPETEVARLLQPFQRGVHTNTPGTGLGLALVSGVTKGHGGYLELVTPAGQGLRATLRLPRTTVPGGR